MFSEQFEQIIRDYRTFLLFILFLLGQIICWREWLRRFAPGKVGRKLVHCVFIFFNLGWAVTIASFYVGTDTSDLLWSWVGRPSVSWQLVQVLGVLPVLVLSSFMSGLVKWFRSKSQGNKGKVKAETTFDKNRRDVLKTMGTVGGLAVLGLSGYGVYRQAREPQVKCSTITLDDLPPALDGLVLAHLTDTHLGLWANQKELDRALAVVAREKPDIVVFTGDMVDRKAYYAKLFQEPMVKLKDVPYGVWGVLGNHDHYTGQPALVAEYLRQGGLNMLVDQQVNLPNLPLRFIGLDDQGVHSSWMGRGLDTEAEEEDVLNFDLVTGPAPRDGDLTILLNHRPDGFAQAARQGCRIILAGHTHGGQYQIPGHDQANLSAIFYKYSNGLYHEHGSWLNVNPGLASVGLPFRLFSWSEISLITLKR